MSDRDRMREIVDKMDNVISDGVMDDATAARLNDLADELDELAEKSGDDRLISAVKSLLQILAAAAAGYGAKLIMEHLADIGGLI